MFDKYLCRKIHKKAITIGDIFEYFLDNVFPKIIKIISCTLLGITLIKFYSITQQISFWQGFKDLLLCILAWAGIIILLLVLFLIFLYICEKISKIRVAECPLNKEEKE